MNQITKKIMYKNKDNEWKLLSIDIKDKVLDIFIENFDYGTNGETEFDPWDSWNDMHNWEKFNYYLECEL